MFGRYKILLCTIAIVGLGVVYGFLYQNVYAQNDKNLTAIAEEAKRIAQQEKSLRVNQSTPDAPTPIMFNSIPEGDRPHFPSEGQIEIEVRAWGAKSPTLGWKGNVAYQNGRNTLSFDGIYQDHILVNCSPYDLYSMSFQKTNAKL